MQGKVCMCTWIEKEFFHDFFNLHSYNMLSGMLHVADRCRQLHELTINYMHVSDDLLLALSREEHVKLKHLCVNIICEDNETSIEHHVIKKDSWDALTRHSPGTILSMCFFVLHDKDFSTFFTYEMPATHVYFGRTHCAYIIGMLCMCAFVLAGSNGGLV